MNKKIDIYTRRFLRGLVNSGWVYECSTTWSKTCKEAKSKYLSDKPFISPHQVKAQFDRNKHTTK